MAKQSGSSTGRKWTKARREKFLATMTAKRKGRVSRGIEVTQLVLAKKLRRLILLRIKEEEDIGEVELTALLLLNELLKPQQ